MKTVINYKKQNVIARRHEVLTKQNVIARRHEVLTKQLEGKEFLDQKDIAHLQRRIAKKYHLPFLPSKIEILKIARELNIKTNIVKKPIRSLSGVAVITVLTKEFPCPGQCIYCPREANLPKSYLSGEPAVERAKKTNFHPYYQVKERIKSLEKQGHATDKIELIVIGGTWSAIPSSYQTWFIKQCYKAANEYDILLRRHSIPSSNNKRRKRKNQSLKELQKINEKSSHRIVGLTLETRPDYINLKEIKRMRTFGCTRAEIGIQSIDDKILAINQRGHTKAATIQATQLLKDAGFKVCYHFMPGLLGSNPSSDLKQFKTLFSDQSFKPDMIKIYPCVVVPGSKLYYLFKEKKYHPYSDKVLIDLLVRMKKNVPPYVRILRVIRDIPSQSIVGGSKISNLREIVQKEMEKRGLKCRCIRCREARDFSLDFKNIQLVRRDYLASHGREIFLSFEDKKNDKLFAFLRLRLPEFKDLNQQLFKFFNVLQGAALIREIHTYGQLTPLGKKIGAVQHYNLGKRLVKEAEKIAKQANYKKIAVISGVGVRNYWRHLGYRLSQTYMVKILKKE